ncbi:chaperone protein dnaJ 20, chloroplastic-like [Durio zibethinus]|uniref:Chaperone protein dnaJ 20, chloroplastic-like n=1 Tax=Durio zibethinus TaxID=66656 RepID=A0A6P6AAQ4_DURZI|nr:chaperone protein dnaJ 20, chloroplastic-like [Durio zibethinus]
MRCGYGLAAVPGSDARFFTLDTSFLRLRRTVNPTRIQFGSFKIKAKIDEARKEMSFYELLGIPETGTLPEIKQAYKQLARKYHPDVSPPDRVEEYTEWFIRVQEAYETLSDPRTRALYDKDLALGIHLAFSTRRRYQYDEELEERSEWRNRWQSQLSELKRRSMNRDAGGNMSWGARMRRQRDEFSKEQ